MTVPVRHSHRLGPLLLVVGAAILAAAIMVGLIKATVLVVKGLAVLAGLVAAAVIVVYRRARTHAS